MKLKNGVSQSLKVLFICQIILTIQSHAGPRPPRPPWPQATLSLYGFDAPFWRWPAEPLAIGESTATLSDSWSGYALNRDSLSTLPVAIPGVSVNGKPEVAPGSGAIRFWYAANYTSANKQLGGAGPGHYAPLVEMVNLGAKTYGVKWSLGIEEGGNTIYLAQFGEKDMKTFLQAPVQFQAGQWRLLTLCYSPKVTTLYVDGAVIAKGKGLDAPAPWEEKSLGIVLGSDLAMQLTAEGQFEELTTFDQWPTPEDEAFYFEGVSQVVALGPQGTPEEEAAKLQKIASAKSGMQLLAATVPPPPGGTGGGGTNGPPAGPQPAYAYPSNTLWLEITTVTNGKANLIVHGTQPDVAYEILSRLALTNVPWASEGTILGAQGQVWTPTTVPVGTRTNALFLWARSWRDSDGSGLPDWWQLQYFGHLGVDPYGDPDGDGWNNLQEYQNGTNPNVFNTPPAPKGFRVLYNSSNSVVQISWLTSPGPVSGHTIVRDVPDTGQHDEFPIASNALSFVDSYPVSNPDPQYYGYWPTYQIQAHYAGGGSAWSGADLFDGSTTASAELVRGQNGKNLLAFATAIPPATTSFRLSRYQYDPPTTTWVRNTFGLSAGSVTNGVAVMPDAWVSPVGQSYRWLLQTRTGQGTLSSPTWVSYNSIPFFDGRMQIKQNLNFLLRVPEGNSSFNYFSNSFQHLVSSPAAYAFSSFYKTRDQHLSYCADNHTVDEFLPFKNNYIYRNFVFSPSEVDNQGLLTTGVTDSTTSGYDCNGNGIWAAIVQFPVSHQFQPPTNLISIPALLGQVESRWTCELPLNTASMAEINITRVPDLLPVTYYMTNTIRNHFGLPYLSAHFAYNQNNTLQFTTLNAGGSIPAVAGYVFPEAATPNLQTVDYYFASPGVDLLPGNWSFAPTNTTPMLLAGVGRPSTIAGYAKQQLLNGYANTFGFLGQYFDKAYRMTNGVAMTNQTGILSPYGDFFPTEPGPTALVTMPDLDPPYGRGTAVVNVVKLQLDVNHDGVMDLSFAGPDNTLQARPMAWWVNNDHDEPASGSNPDRDLAVPPNQPDYASGAMHCQRNLEDFARLWVSGLPKLPTTNGYTITLGMSALSGNPAINLYAQYDTNGSPAYLSDTNAAAAQFTKSYLNNQLILDYARKLKTINPTESYALPVFSDGTPQYTKFLFEGAGIGSCQLTLTISQNTGQGSNVIAQTSTWLDLHDVKDFYERAVITNKTSGYISTWSSGIQSVENAQTPENGEDEDLLVFAHGFFVSETDWRQESATIFKRLYWAGYHGKFASVKWPAERITAMSVLKEGTGLFNLSETQAYKANTAFSNYVNQLRARLPGYRLHLLAHSQGNVMVSEAISKGGLSFDTYILSQAALPASAYDLNAPTNADLVARETIIPTPEWQPFGYHGAYTNLTGRIVNFYNPVDKALGYWLSDQKFFKPSQFYSYDGTNCWYLIDPDHNLKQLVTDTQEARARISRSRTESIGRSGPASGHGVIQSAVNLNAQFGFDGSSVDEHSAQWSRPIQTSRPYYLQIREAIKP